MERLSTNAKLALLINGPDTEEDAEDKLRVEREAKMKLRRATLYGGGARAKVPKVKKKKNEDKSPFTVMEAFEMPGQVALTSAVPPGAHYDQFRLVTNPTALAKNDPDRTFLDSTSMKEGLITVPGGQPPWYFGYQNKTKPPDGNFATMAASRYGFQGAKHIRQRHTEPYERPSNTRTENTPQWLQAEEDVADEWVPPILATVHNTHNGLESPKLWPENTEYPHGYPLKRAPTSHVYVRETTANNIDRPKTSQHLNDIFHRSAEKTMLQDFAKMEIDRTFKSVPMTAQEQFTRNWNEKVNIEANGTLRATMKREVPPYEAHSLRDPTDVIKYSGSTAMIVNQQSSEEVKFRNRLERSKETVPWELRWRKVVALYRGIRARLKRDIPVGNVIYETAHRLRADATLTGASTILKRADFMQAISKIHSYEGFDMKLFNAVYGVFDPLKKNIVRFVEIIKSMAVIDKFEDTSEEKLMTLWDLNMEFGQDMSPFDVAATCLYNVCGSDAEHAEMKRLFSHEFRPTCYRKSINASKIPGGSSQAERPDGMPEGNPDDPNNQATSPIMKKNQVMSALPAYNIIDNYLTRYTFVDVVRNCPGLYAHFDECLDARLAHCYGNGRVKTGSADNGKVADTSDFAWILKKKKKIGSTGPKIARRPSASLVGLKKKSDAPVSKKTQVPGAQKNSP
jgi:hypothetical protein